MENKQQLSPEYAHLTSTWLETLHQRGRDYLELRSMLYKSPNQRGPIKFLSVGAALGLEQSYALAYPDLFSMKQMGLDDFLITLKDGRAVSCCNVKYHPEMNKVWAGFWEDGSHRDVATDDITDTGLARILTLCKMGVFA